MDKNEKTSFGCRINNRVDKIFVDCGERELRDKTHKSEAGFRNFRSEEMIGRELFPPPAQVMRLTKGKCFSIYIVSHNS